MDENLLVVLFENDIILYKVIGVARILSVVVVHVFFGLILYVVNIKKNRKCFNLKYWKFALGFNLPLLPHYFSLYILQQSDRIMIQKMKDYSSVAQYSVVYNVGMIIQVVTDSLNQAMIPWLYRELENKRFESIKKRMNLLVVIVSLILLFFMLFAPEILIVMAPASYYNAVYVMPPIIASILFMFIYILVGNIEFFYDYNKITMFVSIFGALLNILLNRLLIPRYGYVAAGYTTLLCYIVFAVMHVSFSSWITKTKEGIIILDLKFLAVVSISFVMASIGLSFTYSSRWIRYTIILVFLSAMIVFRNKIISFIKPLIKIKYKEE